MFLHIPLYSTVPVTLSQTKLHAQAGFTLHAQAARPASSPLVLCPAVGCRLSEDVRDALPFWKADALNTLTFDACPVQYQLRPKRDNENGQLPRRLHITARSIASMSHPRLHD